MDDVKISPLAKRLAEENSIDWRLIQGTGPDGRVIERDILNYLARIMSGDADLPTMTDVSEPPAPANADLTSLPGLGGVANLAGATAALSKEGVDLSSLLGSAPPVPAAPTESFFSDPIPSPAAPEPMAAAAQFEASAPAVTTAEDEFDDAIFDLDLDALESEPEPVVAEAAPMVETEPVVEATPVAEVASSGPSLEDLFNTPAGFTEPTVAAVPVEPEPMLPSLESILAEPQPVVAEPALTFEPEPTPVFEPEPAPVFEPEPVAPVIEAAPVIEPEPVVAEPVIVEPEPVVAAPEPVFEPQIDLEPSPPVMPEPIHAPDPVIPGFAAGLGAAAVTAGFAASAAPAEPEPVAAAPAPVVEPEPVVAAPVAEAAPAVAATGNVARDYFKVSVLRRHFSTTGLADTMTHLEKALGGAGVPMGAFLARAASRAGMDGVSSIALGKLDGDHLATLSTPNLEGSFRDLVMSVAKAETSHEHAQLTVLDASGLGVDDLVLPTSGALLSMGRSVDGQATLTLSGEFPAAHGAAFLERVTASLENPISLMI